MNYRIIWACRLWITYGYLDYNLFSTYTSRYRKKFNKRTGNWFVVVKKQKKTYDYIHELQRNIYARKNTISNLSRKKSSLSAEDPRNISKSLAPTAPPSSDVLIQRHKSRFRFVLINMLTGIISFKASIIRRYASWTFKHSLKLYQQLSGPSITEMNVFILHSLDAWWR